MPTPEAPSSRLCLSLFAAVPFLLVSFEMREVLGFSLALVIAPLQRIASPAVSLFLWLFGEKIEQRMCAAVGFLSLDLDRFLLRSSPILLLVRRRFGLPLLRLWWVFASGLGCHLVRVGASRFSSVSSGAGSPFPSLSVLVGLFTTVACLVL